MAHRDSAPDVSALVVSWNTRDLTAACLDSLPGSVGGGVTLETIVVDNGSGDGSVEMLRGRTDVVLVENAGNRGYAAAVNQAYERSRGRLVLLLNSDIVFPRGALGTLVEFLEARPDAAGVGPLYLNPDGTPQQHHFRLPTLPMLLAGAGAALRRLPPFARAVRRYRLLGEDFSAPRPVEQPSASCLLLRREALPGDHLLDERFPIYFNDVELAHRLHAAGAALWVTPDAAVYHVHGASTRQLGRDLRRQHLASTVRYLRRTHPPAAVLTFQAVVLAQKLGVLLLRRPGALALGELWAALRGDPGPLPQAPQA